MRDPVERLDADDFFERQRLREQLASLRQEKASEAGTNKRMLDRRIADVEARIAELTKRLPSSLR